MSDLIGEPINRVDGRLKTTGTASYSADFPIPDVTYGFTLQSTITRGRIRAMDTSKAESAPGVIAVFTHQNAPRLHQLLENGGAKSSEKQSEAISSIKYGEKDLLPLQSPEIYYDGQYIALVVAKTLEEAQQAAVLIGVYYDEQMPIIAFDQAQPFQPKESMGRRLQIGRGDPESAWDNAAVKLDQTYSTPVYTHNPMEPQASIAVWEGDKLTLHDSTQAVLGNRDAVALALGIPADHVRVIALFVGGGFGCKGFTWQHSILASMAARVIGRPVKLVLNRQQMFTCSGRRAQTIQHISLGADEAGTLASVTHQVTSDTSFVDTFVETAGLPTAKLYACPNLHIEHEVVRLNRGTPTSMRAPGESTGTFAIESAMDELAYATKVDPIQLRLVNYAETDPQRGKPWSSKHLEECYHRGAQAIGWSQRNPQPRSMPDGPRFIGYGMATAIYPANRVPASARARIFSNGSAEASSCTQDIGTGTYTIMTQITAQALGLPMDAVQFKLGDSTLPKAPVSGGSQTAASVGPAVEEAALAARRNVLRMAAADKRSPLYGQALENITVVNGRCFVKNDSSRGEMYADILNRAGVQFVDGEATTKGSTRAASNQQKSSEQSGKSNNIDLDLNPAPYSFYSFGAQFVRLLFDPLLGTVHLTHCVAVMDIGTVLNPKMATSQIMGGMIFGIGMALMEETVYDPDRGRIVTRDLANYLVPVNADMPEFDVQFIDKPDPHISSIGARGIGEIGITGMAAAIANAVYHASGKRIRDLPITLDKLI